MPKPPIEKLEELDALLADSCRRKAGATRDLMRVMGHQQHSLANGIADALEIDIEAIAQDARTVHRKELQAAETTLRSLRDEARELVRRQAASFDDKLRALRRSGFAQAIESACHNPRLLMKLCYDWDAEGSPPPGIGGTSNRADWDFETIDDSLLGSFIDRVHAHAAADAGDGHWDEAHGDVDLRLQFSHSPLDELTVAEQVAVDLSAFGFIESGMSTDMYISQSRALSAGGDASLMATVSIAQDYVWPSGLRDTNRLELGTETLAHCGSIGAIWLLLGWIPISLGGAPCWEPINLRRRLTFPTVFPIYGRSNPRQPYGEDVRVEVRLRLQTSARGEGSDASIDFRRSEGYSLRVHEVIIETTA